MKMIVWNNVKKCQIDLGSLLIEKKILVKHLQIAPTCPQKNAILVCQEKENVNQEYAILLECAR